MPTVNMKVLGRFRCPYCNTNVSLGVIAATPSMVHEGDACERFNTSSFTQTIADTLRAIPVTRGAIPVTRGAIPDSKRTN